MYLIKGLKKGDCEANDKHTDLECFEAECQSGTFTGLICPKCFLSQVRMRAKSKKLPSRLPNGEAPEGWKEVQA